MTLCDTMHYSPPGSSVREILQAGILEWVTISFSRGSSWPRGWTHMSCIAGRSFTIWATRKSHSVFYGDLNGNEIQNEGRYIYIYMYIYIYICIYMYVCMYTHTHAHTHTSIYIYMRIHTHTHTHTRLVHYAILQKLIQHCKTAILQWISNLITVGAFVK